MEDDSPNVVTHLELCTFLKVSYRTLTTWRQQGIIPFFQNRSSISIQHQGSLTGSPKGNQSCQGD